MRRDWRSWLRLERLFNIHPVDVSDDEVRSFEVASRSLMADNAPAFVSLLVGAAVVFWPLDLWVFGDHPELIALFAQWRLFVVVFLGVGFVVIQRTGAVVRFPEPIAAVAFVVGFGVTAWFMGRVGGMDGPWFAYLTVTPLFTVLVLMPLGARLVMNLSVMGAAWVGFLLAQPDMLAHPSHNTVMVQYLFNCLLGVVTGHVVYLALRANDVAARRLASSRGELEQLMVRLEGLVEARTTELRRVLLAAEGVRERERTWVTRELHDALGQELLALRYGVAMLRTQVGSKVASNAFEPVEELLQRASETVRRILRGLPAELPDHMPLAAALHHMVQEVGERAGVDATFERLPGPPCGGAVVRQSLYRITQEAMTNVLRHAEAKAMWVRLRSDGERVVLEVEDDGRGVGNGIGSAPGGIGMAGIRQRAAELGGAATWLARKGGGTLLRVEIPCTA